MSKLNPFDDVRKRVTMADVAQEAGFSRASVSYVLNNSPRAKLLTPSAIERIQAAAAAMGYKYNDAARAVKTGRSRLLAFLTPPLKWESNMKVFQGAATEAIEHSYQVKYLPMDKRLNALGPIVDICVDRMVSGVMCFNLSKRLILDLQEQLVPYGIATMQVGDEFEGVTDLSVTADCVKGGDLVVKHLVELGHSRVGMLYNSLKYASTENRLSAFKAAAAVHGLDLSVNCMRATGLSPDRIQAALDHFLKLDEPPTAIVCDNDLIAFMLLNACRARGIQVPEQLSVVSYVNLPFCDFSVPPLTSVELSGDQVGSLACRELIRAVEPGVFDLVEAQTPKCRLVVRGSTARLQ
jgi:DNA-binding LacI/PurR family transcriptional regulator